jgi:hypothetical protein
LSKKPKHDLANLPENFKTLFSHTTNRIRRFGNAMTLVDVSFLMNRIVFNADFGDVNKNSQVESLRKLIYEGFNSKRSFVDNKMQELEENHVEYIEDLYAHALINLWISLESLVKQLITNLIKYDERILSASSFKKVSVPIGELFALPDDDRSAYLTDIILANLKCGPSHGIKKFECSLDAFGLSGSFNSKYEKQILELHILRNCIVHNDSTVDNRLRTQCAWLGYKLGDKIVITKDRFHEYETAVLAYIAEIFYRLNKEFGAPEVFLDILKEKIEDAFSDSNEAT